MTGNTKRSRRWHQGCNQPLFSLSMNLPFMLQRNQIIYLSIKCQKTLFPTAWAHILLSRLMKKNIKSWDLTQLEWKDESHPVCQNNKKWKLLFTAMLLLRDNMTQRSDAACPDFSSSFLLYVVKMSPTPTNIHQHCLSLIASCESSQRSVRMNKSSLCGTRLHCWCSSDSCKVAQSDELMNYLRRSTAEMQFETDADFNNKSQSWNLSINHQDSCIYVCVLIWNEGSTQLQTQGLESYPKTVENYIHSSSYCSKLL